MSKNDRTLYDVLKNDKEARQNITVTSDYNIKIILEHFADDITFANEEIKNEFIEVTKDAIIKHAVYLSREARTSYEMIISEYAKKLHDQAEKFKKVIADKNSECAEFKKRLNSVISQREALQKTIAGDAEVIKNEDKVIKQKQSDIDDYVIQIKELETALDDTYNRLAAVRESEMRKDQIIRDFDTKFAEQNELILKYKEELEIKEKTIKELNKKWYKQQEMLIELSEAKQNNIDINFKEVFEKIKEMCDI